MARKRRSSSPAAWTARRRKANWSSYARPRPSTKILLVVAPDTVEEQLRRVLAGHEVISAGHPGACEVPQGADPLRPRHAPSVAFRYRHPGPRPRGQGNDGQRLSGPAALILIDGDLQHIARGKSAAAPPVPERRRASGG